MNKINFKELKRDNSLIYNYRDEDTFFFVNFKNLILVAIIISYIGTICFGGANAVEYIQLKHVSIGTLVIKYSFYVGLMILQIFVICNYRFLIRKKLKKFSWFSCIFILIHSIFYIVILNIILIGGPNLIYNILR